MPIPKDILAVERPKNTVVVVYGKNKNLYAVRQRIGCKNINGRHVPVNGPTIGHIVDGVYIPNPSNEKPSVSNLAATSIDLKDWAGVMLCDKIFNNILDELAEVYNREDAVRIYCIAILRVCNPGIKDYELKEAYETSFLSELYPDVALSKNAVCVFLGNLGKTLSLITKFMKNRAKNINVDHHLLIDGTLKSNESKVNSLSDFSRKAKLKGSRDISVLYAFDLEAMEPVCSKCYPGNMLDSTAYSDFIVANGITRGIIVGDKGFPFSAASEEFESHPDLHYLNPIKRNSKLIETHNMYDFTAILTGYEGITYRKEKCNGKNKWLYSFRNSILAAQEEQAWLVKAKKEGTYSLSELRKKQKSFGTIILECDLDLPPEIVFKAYEKRWEIELVMRYYKFTCEFDETRVHDDYSVIGSEFCNFLSAVLTFRMIAAFDEAKLLEKHTYKKIMSVLAKAKKIRLSDDNWILIRMNPYQIEMLQDLSLLPKPEKEPSKGVGRPKGSKNKPKTPSAEEPVKRKPGRPRGSKNKPKAT